MQRTRRSVLAAAAGSLAAAPLAGCTIDAAGEAYAAFFPLADLTRGVADGELTVNDPVPVGQVGHGWSPSGELTPEIASSSAFVYLDTPEFGWAQDVAAVVREEGHDVALIDALERIDLRTADHGGHGGDGGTDGGSDDGDGDASGGHDGGQDGSGGSDAAHDPHAWIDPVNAATMVETIRDGLVEAVPDAADAFRDGADATLAALSDLDAAYESTVADAEHDAIVVASHDSFEYLAARYGFSVHTPFGISPHEEPSTRAVVDAVEFVDSRGIDYVLYDTFQPSRWAETVVAESDASEALPVSTISATTREWNERGWGYVEQHREINLPAIARALGAAA